MGVPNGVMTVVADEGPADEGPAGEGLVDEDLVDLVDGGPVVVDPVDPVDLVDPVDPEQNQLIKRN